MSMLILPVGASGFEEPLSGRAVDHARRLRNKGLLSSPTDRGCRDVTGYTAVLGNWWETRWGTEGAFRTARCGRRLDLGALPASWPRSALNSAEPRPLDEVTSVLD